MKTYDVVGWVYDGETYCLSHPPAKISKGPIFADSEWDYYPVCGECWERIDAVSLTGDGVKYEHESAKEHGVECPVDSCVFCRDESRRAALKPGEVK